MNERSARVTVVIPNWNGISFLPECLASLRAQSYSDFRVVVVDNASADESVGWVRAKHPEVEVVERADNGGFAVAVNAGIALADGDYVALLNNDTVADTRWLDALVEALDSRPDYDVAASKMLFADRPEILNAAGDVYSVGRSVGVNRGKGGAASAYDVPVRILGACAGAALYRRSLFGAIGVFDERFFLVSEDTDLNLRALIAGRKTVYVPGAVVLHKESATIRKRPSLEMDLLRARNAAIVVAQDLPWPAAALWYLLWPWRLFRNSVPLRPSKWRDLGRIWEEERRRLAAEAEGLRLGRQGRRAVWERRSASYLEILRWVFAGTGPLD